MSFDWVEFLSQNLDQHSVVGRSIDHVFEDVLPDVVVASTSGLQTKDYLSSSSSSSDDEGEFVQFGGAVSTRSPTRQKQTHAEPPPPQVTEVRREEHNNAPVIARIVSGEKKKLLRFNIESFNTCLKVINREARENDVGEAISVLTRTLDKVIGHLKKEYGGLGDGEDSLLFVKLDSPSLDNPIVMPLMPAKDLTVERLANKIDHVAQSNKEFILEGVYDIYTSVVVKPPKGSGNDFILDECDVSGDDEDDDDLVDDDMSVSEMAGHKGKGLSNNFSQTGKWIAKDAWLTKKRFDVMNCFEKKRQVFRYENYTLEGAIFAHVSGCVKSRFKYGRFKQRREAFLNDHKVAPSNLEESFAYWGNVLENKFRYRLVVVKVDRFAILDPIAYVHEAY